MKEYRLSQHTGSRVRGARPLAAAGAALVLAIVFLCPTARARTDETGSADLLGASASLPAAPLDVTTLSSHDAIRPGGTVDLAVVLNLTPGWHVNANQPLEEWLIPTEILPDSTADVELVEIVYPEPRQISLEFSEVPLAVYESGSAIGLRVRLIPEFAGEAITIRGAVSYQACNDETCLPPNEVPFSATLAVAPPGEPITATGHPVFTAIRFRGEGEAAMGAPAAGLAGAGGAPGEDTRLAASDRTGAEPPDGDASAPGPGGESTLGPAPGAAASGELTTGESATGGDAGVKSRLVGALERHFGNPILAILITLIAGLASAATPCVYPMIPITARILMSRGGGNSRKGRAHAFAYFGGIILVYGILGFVAGITGGAFNELMRIPLVILAFAVLFALLGLSMLGLFEIQIPASIASKVDSSTSSRTGFAGTMLMGVGAGLVVSPCVGPVVIFILTQIAAQIAIVQAAGSGALSSTGQVLYGAYLMAGYGAGLGIPFLVVGFFSTRLARPGPWMTAVRVALGLVILYFAYDYFHKALSTAGVERALANAVLTGVVLVFLAVLGGVFRTRIEEGPHAGWQKVKLASTIIMLIVGIFFLWTGLTRSGIVAGGSPEGSSSELAGSGTSGAAPASDPGADGRVEITRGLVWHRDFAEAQSRARTESLPIFVDFYAHWCANCKVFSRQAAEAGPLRMALESVVLAKVYDTDAVFQEFQNDPRFPELKVGLPFFLLLSPTGEFLWKGTDYRAHETMMREIDRARSRSS